MPGQFGEETPQEAVARVSASFAKQRQQFNNSNLAGNQYALLGQSLGNIFGGSIKKTLDTRSARKSEAQRMVEETGMSVQEARAAAKESVPRDFREVRIAKQRRDASKVASRTYDQTAGTIGHARATAAAQTVMAAQLRRQGFPAEATAMTIQADATLKAEELRELGLKSLHANVRTDVANADKAELDRDTHELKDTVPFLTRQVESLTAQMDVVDDPEERASLGRIREHTLGRILRLNNISLSDADLKSINASGANTIQLDLLDSVLLDERFGLLEDTVRNFKGDWASTTVGAVGSAIAAGLEGLIGVDPGTWGADELVADVTTFKAFPTFAAYRVRHSLTGAAMSAHERPLMEPFLPEPGDGISTMLGKISAIRAYTQLDIQVRTDFVRAYIEDGEIPKTLDLLMKANQSASTAQRRAATADNAAALGEVKVLDADVTKAIGVSDAIPRPR
jgi:hypothetical protein